MAPETTCSKCMYIDYPCDEFPCDICLNSGKLVENMVEPNWAPPGAVKAEKPVVRGCHNCRFDPRPISSYPCNRCVDEEDYEKYWEPEEEKVETPVEPFVFESGDWLNVVVTSAKAATDCTIEVHKAPKPFWIVCADAGSLEAHVRHDSEESAVREANRLALKTGKTFQVFKSVAKVTGKTTASQENYA